VSGEVKPVLVDDLHCWLCSLLISIPMMALKPLSVLIENAQSSLYQLGLA